MVFEVLANYLKRLSCRSKLKMSFTHFHTIGIGVTFSPNLTANIFEASRIALRFNARLILIHVGEVSEEKKETFVQTISPFAAKGLHYEIVFKPGKPVDSIVQVVSEKKIDLLIVGALKRENFLKYYMGSIARKITRKAPCSVLLLINPSVEKIPCKHIIVNGLEQEKTEHTIQEAFYVAHALESEKITIVEEISQQEIAAIEDDKSLRKATLEKEKLRRREVIRVNNIVSSIPDAHKKNIVIASQPIFGKRGYSIGHFAQVARADLLIMNAPQKTGFMDRLFPHDLEHILTELPTDVLIIQ